MRYLFLQEKIEEIKLLTSSENDFVILDKEISNKLNNFHKTNEFNDDLVHCVLFLKFPF